MARGGRRAGTKGTAYTNRTDLQQDHMPLSAPRGLPYGDRAKLVAAQRAVPMAPASAPAPAAPAPGNPPPAQGPVPGSLPFLHPTMRPNEPVTAGLPVGPGPGPEALSGIGAAGMGQAQTADTLSQLARMPGAGPELANLAAYAQAGRA